MKIRLYLTIILLCSFTTQNVQGQEKEFKRVGKSGFSFLKISPSARAAGMGDAFTAVANDISAIFYNPAGLTHIDQFDFTFGVTNWIVGSKLYSGAIARPYGKRSVLGLSIVQFSPEEFEETTVLEPTGTGRLISVGDVSIGLAYAIKLTDQLSFGFKGKWIEEWIDSDKAHGIALDFATYYYSGFKDLSIAMIMKNFGPEAEYLSDKFKLPLYFNVNTAMSIIGEQGSPIRLLISAESAFATDYRDRYHVGSELQLLNILSIRGGYKFFYDTEDWTAGIGLNVKTGRKKIFVDIAYSNFSEYFEPPFRLSVGGSF
ncbi:MAG: PorV/PorQ family protein [Candidatus Marinimicrobia bacterium]|jgi:hypothetical protein|nr:PorV/PorQ family protein [Candidatus Neomarinimicrobiota bacterium]MBT3937227.1 PorV/PorQ family protein [Candidatus Neomarinimicrobiota bacterium]MBT3961511.1 PorV/PorQ family protein [Candidatus Neomarinimicrobiota bacterium]MBT4382242.1 PorV/PorQ family protein [Candidatus Neomarinimicrobiota bacterium]MBT4635708.1 PorV/PorQ family protein [Candidatus Neomarinimicrobiota bacterium]